jgi:hypothetical protein
VEEETEWIANWVNTDSSDELSSEEGTAVALRTNVCTVGCKQILGFF